VDVCRREGDSRRKRRDDRLLIGVEWLAHGLVLQPWFMKLLSIITEENEKV
jgi:hypothetical protein